MKIIQIVPSIADEASGPSYLVSRLCRSLLDQGIEVTLAVLDWAPMKSQPEFLKIFPLGIGPQRLGRSPMMSKWLRERCAAGDISILHNHGMWYMMSLYAAWATRSASVRFVQSTHNTLSDYSLRSGSRLKPLFWRILQKKALRSASCFHATCEAEYRDVRTLGFQQPVAIIPSGVDVPTFRAKRKSSATSTLTYLGRLHPEKGLENLLAAWKYVQDDFKSWQMRLIGPGKADYTAHLKSRSADLKLDRVEFAGPMYGDDKWRAYADTDLYVLPSPSENFAMSVAEALAAGTPAIVSKGAPWAGLVDEGAGWWIDIGVEPLAAALHDAMSRDPAELSNMGLRGRAWMEQDFSWDRIGQQMAEVYRWLLNPQSTPPACIRLD